MRVDVLDELRDHARFEAGPVFRDARSCAPSPRNHTCRKNDDDDRRRDAKIRRKHPNADDDNDQRDNALGGGPAEERGALGVELSQLGLERLLVKRGEPRVRVALA